jgi:hypothetical protein
MPGLSTSQRPGLGAALLFAACSNCRHSSGTDEGPDLDIDVQSLIQEVT